MLQRAIVVFALFAAVSAGFGCAYGEVRQVVRAQFASELDCPEVFITKRDAWYQYDSPNQFKVSGCGVMRTYTCPVDEGTVSYDKPACTWVEGDADAPKLKARDDEGNVIDESEQVDDQPAEPTPGDEPIEPEDPTSDDSSDDEGGAGDSDSDLGADGETSGSTSVKPAAKKGGGASGQASGGFKVGVGKKR